jgi:lysophospholipase L1-like esterase
MSGCAMINCGISGETTAQSLLRINRDVISLKPDIVVIELGVNDCNSIGVLPEISDFIITSCKNNLNKIIDVLHRKKIKTVVLTIFPVATVSPYQWPIWSEKTRDAIREINTFLLQVDIPGMRVINCDTIFMSENKMIHDYAEDMLHLNRHGYRKLNALIKPHLMKLVEKNKKRD